MKKKILAGLATWAMACVLAVPADAVPLYATGAGNSVAAVDYSATFTTITTGQSLFGYTENNLVVSIEDDAYTDWSPGPGFDDHFHYGSGGNYSYVSITTADSQQISGLEFLLGSGWYGGPGYLAWEIFDDGSLVGSGNSGFIEAGTVVGWSDLDGFDELRVGFSIDQGYTLGQFQAIALDNLNVQTQATSVPEPSTLLLLGSGLLGMVGLNRRRKA